MRITRIDQPEAMLVAPDQAFFLRENLKLRLLNARLALLARQFEAAQIDLRGPQGAIDRYFDRTSQRTAARRPTCFARWRCRRARPACRGPTTRSPR